MIKLKDLLIEAQTFNFNRNKGEILRLIKKVKSGESLTQYDNPFYTIIRNDIESVGVHKTMGFKDDAPQIWKNFFFNKFFNTDGVWSQRDFNSSKKVKQDGKTYNFYITVETDKNNVQRFINSYINLDNSLKKYSDDKGVAISYKTHTILDAFLVDNDSLKVYYWDPSLKSDIENIVKKWASDNKITVGNRSHEHGIDIEGRGSYGVIISTEVLKQFINVIKKHPNHSDEDYYQWILKHFVEIIKSIKIQ